MITSRWRKVIRDLWINKTRTILVILSIAVGVTSIGMVLGSQLIVDRDLPNTYLATNPPSATIFTLTTFDDDMVDNIRALPEVEEAEGRRFVSIRYRVGDSDWYTMQLLAIPDFEDIRLSKVQPQAGEYPPPEQTLLLERASFSPLLGLQESQIGDTLIVEPPDGKERTMRISGTVHDIGQPPASLLGIAYGYVTYDTLEWLGEPREYNQLFFTVTENKFDAEYIQNVGKIVEEKLEKGGMVVLFTLVPPPGDYPLQFFLDAMSYLLAAMGILSLILSGFLIVNTLSAIMTQQVRYIGIMKAVGAKANQIMVMYFVLVFLFGVLALMLAIPLGAVGSVGLASIFATLLNFDLTNVSLEPQVVLIQIVIGLAAPMLAAIYPVLRGSRVTVREAVSDYSLGKGQFGTHFLDQFVLGLRRVIPMQRPSQISLRNTFRRKGRLFLTLTTLSLASAIFISIFSIRASLQQTLDDALNYFDYDIQVQFSREYRINRLTREATSIPGVDFVESWGFASTRIERPDGTESDSIVTYGLPENSPMVNPILIEGRWLRPGESNAVVFNSDAIRNEEGLGVGDTVVLNINGEETEWVMVGVVQGTLTGSNAFVNYDHFSRITNTVGRSPFLLFNTAEDSPAFRADMAQAIEDHFRDNGYRVEQTQTIDQFRNILNTVFNVIIVFLLAMAVLLGFVGGLGLMGTMSINVLERTREIGVMRAIGASDRSVLRIVLLEGVIIGILSWFIGGTVALPLSSFLTRAVGFNLLRFYPTFIFSVPGTVLWLVVVIILAIVASFLPARGASRLTVREVLSYE